jgi:hypothetical protein
MTHSTFSPSSSNRWMVCQQSLIPPEGMHYVRDEEETQWAKDGTAKHKLGEWAISNNCDTVDALLMDMSFAGLRVTTDMVEAADVYVNAIRDLMTRDPSYNMLDLELRVSMPEIHEDMEGTLDARLYSEAKKHLIVGDAKFGWKVVEAAGNWQLRSYAIGATQDLEDLGYEVERITCFICQPTDKFEPVKTVEYSRKDLKQFIRQMKQATKGNAVQAGDHCEYCQRAHMCETLEAYVQEVVQEASQHDVGQYDAILATKSPEQIADILNRSEAVKVWFGAVAGWAKQIMLLGGDVPGYMLYDGQGNRRYIDAGNAEKVLKAKFGDDIYEPLVLRSPAQIENIWPAAKVVMKELTERPRSGLKLKRKED